MINIPNNAHQNFIINEHYQKNGYQYLSDAHQPQKFPDVRDSIEVFSIRNSRWWVRFLRDPH
jgi:hypothetical protein